MSILVLNICIGPCVVQLTLLCAYIQLFNKSRIYSDKSTWICNWLITFHLAPYWGWESGHCKLPLDLETDACRWPPAATYLKASDSLGRFPAVEISLQDPCRQRYILGQQYRSASQNGKWSEHSPFHISFNVQIAPAHVWPYCIGCMECKNLIIG